MSSPHFSTHAELLNAFHAVFKGLPHGIIFDCDGVIVDSFAANISFYNAVRALLSLPPMDAAQAKFAHMGTAQQALEHVIPRPFHAMIPELKAKATLQSPRSDDFTPMPGLRPFVQACKGHGILTGICTNRLNGMENLLQACEVDGLFSPVITVADAPAKPDPTGTNMVLQAWRLQPQATLFIGDSETDRDAAQAAGIPFVAFRNLEIMDGAIAAVYDFADLHQAFEKLWVEF